MRILAAFRFSLWVVGAATTLLLAAYLHAVSVEQPGNQHQVDQAPSSGPAGPPWRYGRPEARFLLISYGDFECPHCKDYFPQLRRWIEAHPEVQWEWRHLPLPAHEPAASTAAQLAECVGSTTGSQAFFDAVDWIYHHTRTLGQGLPDGLTYPVAPADVSRCLNNGLAEPMVRAHVETAARDGIVATPTLQLVDRSSGRTLLLPGPVIGDALLSALDLLAVAHDVERDANTLPATTPGGRPR